MHYNETFSSSPFYHSSLLLPSSPFPLTQSTYCSRANLIIVYDLILSVVQVVLAGKRVHIILQRLKGKNTHTDKAHYLALPMR